MAESIDSFLRAIEDLKLRQERAVEAEVRESLRLAQRIVQDHTPVRTGKTRKSIRSKLAIRRSGDTVRYRGLVYSGEDTNDYMPRLERRYGMFQAGRVFIERKVEPRLVAALEEVTRDFLGSLR